MILTQLQLLSKLWFLVQDVLDITECKAKQVET